MNVLMWFKRDLRIHDHPALCRAAQVGAAQLGAVLPLYIIEPDMWAQPDASGRQWGMVAEALADLRGQLGQIGAPLIVRTGGAVEVLARLTKRHAITHIISHQETGNAWTFARDRSVAAWARDAGIVWEQLAQSGVTRGRKTPDWGARRAAFMAAKQLDAPQLAAVAGLEGGPIPRDLRLADDPSPYRQIGGRAQGLALMDSFDAGRGRGYARGMSSPITAERACSRLSPHLAVGALSLREVVQGLHGNAVQSRLAWRDHFIQKLESQPSIEWRAQQPSSEVLGRNSDAARLAAWQAGETGLPFLDACMRYLNATGWLNFRMRAMVMSAASYHLWLDWRVTGAHLARQFTDYEAGIHWPQVQMQSGVTGINTPRIYNPVKQGVDQDPMGIFTRRWVPELGAVPDAYLHSPWKWTGAGQVLGRKYPEAIVDVANAGAAARAQVWQARKPLSPRSEAAEVIERHGLRRDQAAAISGQMVMDL